MYYGGGGYNPNNPPPTNQGGQGYYSGQGGQQPPPPPMNQGGQGYYSAQGSQQQAPQLALTIAPQPTHPPPGQQQQQHQQAPFLSGGAGYGGHPNMMTTAAYTQQSSSLHVFDPLAPPPRPASATGFTSSGLSTSGPPQANPYANLSRPSSPYSGRISYLTQADQSKFEILFSEHTSDGVYISTEKAKEILMRSKLPSDRLARIWSLADVKSSGQLTFPEFAVALYLTAQQAKDRQNAPPPSLTSDQLNELHKAVAHVLTPVGNPNQPDRARTPGPPSSLIDMASSPVPQSQGHPGLMGPSQGQQGSMQTSYSSSSMTGAMVPTGGMGGGVSHAPPPSFQPPPPPPSSGFYPTENIPWVVTPEQKAGYDQIFRAWDNGTGYLGGERAKEIFMQTGLGPQSLEKIWALADTHNHGRLNADEFAVAMHLTHEVLSGKPLPVRLTPELIPPSTRNLTSSVSSLKADLVEDIMHQRHTGGAYVGARSGSGPSRGSTRRPADDWDAPTRVPKMGPLHDAHDRYGSYDAGFPDTSRSRNSESRTRRMITSGRESDQDFEAETAYTSKARRAIPSRESSKSRDPWASLRSTTDRWGTGGLETPSSKGQAWVKVEDDRGRGGRKAEGETEENKVARWRKELGEQRVILETVQYKVGDPSISYATKEELEARVEERKVRRRVEELERWIHRIESQWKHQGRESNDGRRKKQEEEDRRWMEERSEDKGKSKGSKGSKGSGWKKGSLEVDYEESDSDDEEDGTMYAQTLKEKGEEGLRERMDRERRQEEEKEREAKYAEMEKRRQDRESRAKEEEQERRKARPGETEEQRVRRLAEERLAARMAALSIPTESPPRSPRSSRAPEEEEEERAKSSLAAKNQEESMADRLARAGNKEERQKILEEEAEKRMRDREAFLRATGSTPSPSPTSSRKEAKAPTAHKDEGDESESGGEALGERNPFKRMMSATSPPLPTNETKRFIAAATRPQASKEDTTPDGQRREDEEMALMKELYERRREEERRKEEDRRRERDDVMAGAKKAREEVMRKAQAAKESGQSSSGLAPTPTSGGSVGISKGPSPASGSGNAMPTPGFQKALALFDYTAVDTEGLGLAEGEALEVEEASLMEESDWVYGRKQGEAGGVMEGWVPRTYVQYSMVSAGSSSVPTTETGATSVPDVPSAEIEPRLRMLYPYEATDTDELTVAEDEVVVQVLGTDDGEGWIRVRRSTGSSGAAEEGLVPEAYCEPISEGEVTAPREKALLKGPMKAEGMGGSDGTNTSESEDEVEETNPSTDTTEEEDVGDEENPFGKGGVSKVDRALGLSLDIESPHPLDEAREEEDPFADGVEYSPTHSPTFSPTFSTPEVIRVISADSDESGADSGGNLASVPASPSHLARPQEERRRVSDGGIGLSYQRDGMERAVRSESLGQGTGGFMLMDAMLQETSPGERKSWGGMVGEKMSDGIGKNERLRQEGIFELILTEKTFLRDIQLVVELYCSQLSRMLSEKDMQEIFSVIEDILSGSTLFLSQLEERQLQGGMIMSSVGDLFLQHMENTGQYFETYCGRQSVGSIYLQRRLQEDSSLAHVLQKLQKDPRSRNLDLFSFLLQPMQRLTRYPLLLKQILQHTPGGHPDQPKLEEAVKAAQGLLEKTNRRAQEEENRAKADEVSAAVDLSRLSEPLDLHGVTHRLGPRTFLLEGRLSKAKSGRRLQAFLFSDVLLLTERLGQSAYGGSDSTGASPPLFSSHLTLYREPLLLNEVSVRDVGKMIGEGGGGVSVGVGKGMDETCFQINHAGVVITVKSEGGVLGRKRWVSELEKAIATIKKAERDHFLQYRMGQTIQSSLPHGPQGTLRVRILGATELYQPDTRVQRITTNPFVRVTLREKTMETSIAPDCIAPHWDEAVDFPVNQLSDTLYLDVYHAYTFKPPGNIAREGKVRRGAGSRKEGYVGERKSRQVQEKVGRRRLPVNSHLGLVRHYDRLLLKPRE
ncbi:hypothetical protein BJ684DRAFT_20114 [Piptocephalis cylindrospora]|uniref:Actin cytoskeleton-regulatory complex protein PAN1 n=1 Tax=Piptocephalis cylindrospora TaxID=1907219 RepID=A0A4P9Y3V8_9FUNG|nr:hypothetical protein BJ684DRAFT_20114 [Piptocephalis cylindrospora]|eukprot:RKP13394.1 hypothetical protein BJ684DRAFT_20114 [Piptocephalis cylindrospora]